jgi:hypothetical protein
MPITRPGGLILSHHCPYNGPVYRWLSHMAEAGTFLILTFAFVGSIRAQSVTLAWNADTDPTAIGYNVWWGNVSGGPYPNKRNVGNVTTTTITGLSIGTYYFVCTAYNASNANSVNSNEVPATIPNPPAHVTIPAPGILAQGPSGTLKVGADLWSFGSTLYWNGYPILLNGVRTDNGMAAGIMLFNCNGTLMTVDAQLNWYRWSGTHWVSAPIPPSL